MKKLPQIIIVITGVLCGLAGVFYLFQAWSVHRRIIEVARSNREFVPFLQRQESGYLYGLKLDFTPERSRFQKRAARIILYRNDAKEWSTLPAGLAVTVLNHRQDITAMERYPSYGDSPIGGRLTQPGYLGFVLPVIVSITPGINDLQILLNGIPEGNPPEDLKLMLLFNGSRSRIIWVSHLATGIFWCACAILAASWYCRVGQPLSGGAAKSRRNIAMYLFLSLLTGSIFGFRQEIHYLGDSTLFYNLGTPFRALQYTSDTLSFCWIGAGIDLALSAILTLVILLFIPRTRRAETCAVLLLAGTIGLVVLSLRAETVSAMICCNQLLLWLWGAALLFLIAIRVLPLFRKPADKRGGE